VSEWKRIAPITHAETDGPGRRFVWGLAAVLVCIPLTMLAMRKWALPIVEKKQAEQRAAIPTTGQLHTITLDIHGMECAMCAVHVEEAIGKVPGVKSVKADFETGKTEVICQAPDTAQLAAAIADAVATTKYTIGPSPDPDNAAKPADEHPKPDSTADGSSKPENAEPTPNTP
jgi:copper chaperone CopZ